MERERDQIEFILSATNLFIVCEEGMLVIIGNSRLNFVGLLNGRVVHRQQRKCLGVVGGLRLFVNKPTRNLQAKQATIGRTDSIR